MDFGDCLVSIYSLTTALREGHGHAGSLFIKFDTIAIDTILSGMLVVTG